MEVITMSYTEYSKECPKCGNELIVQLEYTDINYDPRDGYTEYGYNGGIVDKEFRECKCDFTQDEEDKIVEEKIKAIENDYPEV